MVRKPDSVSPENRSNHHLSGSNITATLKQSTRSVPDKSDLSEPLNAGIYLTFQPARFTRNSGYPEKL